MPQKAHNIKAAAKKNLKSWCVQMTEKALVVEERFRWLQQGSPSSRTRKFIKTISAGKGASSHITGAAGRVGRKHAKSGAFLQDGLSDNFSKIL